MFDFPVDFVITWVDGSDPLWLSKKQIAERKVAPDVEANVACRFEDSDELRYALRSLFKYCPWFHKIYIVTDSQRPQWLDLQHERVVLVDHTEIFDETGALPSFNSNVIESFVHRIPGLSEHFIAFNDDFFIGRSLRKEFFFHADGTPRVCMSGPQEQELVAQEVEASLRGQGNLYVKRVNRTRRIIEEHLGQLPCYAPKHIPVALRKSDVAKVEQEFAQELAITRACQFRHETEVKFFLLCQYALLALGTKVTPLRFSLRRNAESFFSTLDYWKISMGRNRRVNWLEYRLITLLRTACVCINDDKITLESDRARMKGFLKRRYSKPSPAEIMQRKEMV